MLFLGLINANTRPVCGIFCSYLAKLEYILFHRSIEEKQNVHVYCGEIVLHGTWFHGVSVLC